MSKLSFRARALDASKPMPIYLAEELPDLPDYSAINRAVPQMPSGMEKEEESTWRDLRNNVKKKASHNRNEFRGYGPGSTGNGPSTLETMSTVDEDVLTVMGPVAVYGMEDVAITEEHHLQRAISGTGLIIPTPEVSQVCDIEFYERCYPPDYKMPKQHIHMQPLWEEQEAPEYDMDSEDERWLKQQRHPELTELKFEQMMDKLEKSSGQTVVTLNEAKLLLERQDDLVIAVYDYWLNKRLTTQHPLILSVRTENRPGQSSNNPYLAFRRRTEKMQTRKNRKNDESSYEKMLKLRRDLARALNLLELVARRERAKRELVKLTALLADRRYAAGDFANQLLPDPPPRPTYTAPITTNAFRPERYTVSHYPPRPQPNPVDAPRQREKRTYKRRKHRHPPTAPGHRDSGVYSSSEDESQRTEPSSPPDDGPFAFRRKPGCFYEMPTSTLCGDPVDPGSPTKEHLFDHELDPRHRYTLTSIKEPYPQCIGFARRRVGRGGRVVIDRVSTPLDDLWPNLPLHRPDTERELREIENQRHRTPKEITTDYHTSGKYPWRHAFRRHLSRNPHLWTDIKPDVTAHRKPPDVKCDVKAEPRDAHSDNVLPDIVQDSEKCSERTIGGRKRSYSDCSDSSYDSDDSLQPVEREFQRFIDEVDNKWLHFRPRTPPTIPPPPRVDSPPLAASAPLCVELTAPSEELGPFLTSQFSLRDLFADNCAGLSEDQMDLKPLEDRKMAPEDMDLDVKDPFLLHGQSSGAPPDSGRPTKKADQFGSSRVRVTAGEREPIYCAAPPASISAPASAPAPAPHRHTPKKTTESRSVRAEAPAQATRPAPAPAPAPLPAPPVPVSNARIIVEEVSDVTHVTQAIRHDKRKKEDTIEEVQLAPGVQLKTVQTLHSPLKKHIITSGTRCVRSEPTAPAPAHTDALKVRLQNHLLSSQGGVLVQNGPFPQVVSLPVHTRENVVGVTAGGSSGSPCRRAAPVVQISHAHAHTAPLVVHSHAQPKLKVLHATPLTHTQRTQLLAQNRGIGQLPAVVSLATLSDPKSTALFKAAAQGSVAQLFEIKSGQLGKGPHLVNVVRQPQPGKATIARLDLNDKKRQVVFDGTLKGNIPGATRPHRVSVSLDGRQFVRAPLPAARHPPLRHQIQVKNRTAQQGLQVTAPQIRSATEPSTSFTIAAPQTKTTSIPSSVVANLLHKNVQLPKGGQKIAISGGGAQALSANVQAIAITAAQLKARQTRLIAQPRPNTNNEIMETPATSSQQSHSQDGDDAETNGSVRRRAPDTPMEVT